MESHQETFPAFWRSCSTIGPSDSAGKNVSAPTMITTPISRTTHSDAGRRERAERRRDAALGRHRAGEGEDRDDHPVAADEHRERARDVVEGRVAGQPGEGRAVVAGLAREGVQDLAEAVRTRVERPGRALRQHARDRREAEDAGAEDERDEHRHLDLEGLDLLAEVLRRPADHQAGDEHGEDRADDEHPVHPGADAARRDLAELDVEQRDEPGDRLGAVVPGVDGAGARAGRDRHEQAADGGTEADLLAFHVAEARLVDAGREQRVADGTRGSSPRPRRPAGSRPSRAKIVQPWRWLPAYRPKV